MPELQAALFLDRDGVMNEDTAYAHGEHKINLVPGIVDIFKFLQEHPIFLPIIVSNQSGIARGIYTYQDCTRYVHRLMQKIKKLSGYDKEYYSYYADSYNTSDEHLKPNPGMLLQAAEIHSVVLRESYIIGDHMSDLQAGHAAGCRGLIHRFPGTNVFDLFRCIPEVKYLLENKPEKSIED